MHIKGDKELQSTLNKIADKSTEATASALNALAYDVRREVQGKIPTWVKLTKPFLTNSVVYEKASRGNLASKVGFHRRANFAKLLEEGGSRTPKGKALAVPVEAKQNSKGGISASNRPKAVLQKKGVFSGVVNGLAGIWQSTKRIPLRLLYAFKPKTTYDKKFLHFKATADEVAKRNYAERFKNSILKILSK